jgi:parallel beta-helix repeat protein
MKNYLCTFGICAIFSLLFASCQKNEFDSNKTTPFVKPTVYYVSATGSDNNNGTAKTSPFQTLGKVIPLTLPGDSVYITGVYNMTATVTITNSGSPGKFITYAALPGTRPKFIFSGNLYNSIVINASYIKFEGIEMQGDNQNLTYADALASELATAKNGNNGTGVYNMNGLSVGPVSKTATVFPTHIEVRKCIVHDFPAGGIGCGNVDYYTCEDNISYNNSWYTIYATSGMGMITPYDSDNNTTTYRNVFRRNICYNNKTTIIWLAQNKLSDGNGIIIDVNTTSAGNGPAYTGRTLVEDNISFNNGGSGIHAFSAGHVDIINNTAYNNGQVVGYADIYASYSNDCRVMNNIAYARTGGKTNDIKNNTNVTYDYNIYYNTTSIVGAGPHDIVADPQFINLSVDPAVANFQLQASSPAVNSGGTTVFSAIDFLKVARPKGAGPDRGAYESF